MRRIHTTKTLVLILVCLFFNCASWGNEALKVFYAPWVDAQYKSNWARWSRDAKEADQQRIVEDYEANPTNASASRKFVVAVAYGYSGELEKSAALLRDFPEGQIQSDPALYLLGVTDLVQGHVDEGISCLEKSWNHGFKRALCPLAIGYARVGRQKDFERLVTNILEELPKDPLMVDTLAVSATLMHPFNTNLFSQAMEHISDAEIAARGDIEFALFVQKLWETGQFARARRVIIVGEPRHGEGAIDCLAVPSSYRKDVIKNYEQDPSAWKPEELLLAAVCYANQKEYEKARPLYESYLAAHADSKRARRGLGLIYFLGHDNARAKSTFKKGWEMGDLASLNNLAVVYESLGEYDEMRPLVTDLLAHKKEDMEIIGLLIVWAGNSPQPSKKVFDEAIEGLSDEVILSHPELCKNMIQGLYMFGETSRAQRLEEKAGKRKVI